MEEQTGPASPIVATRQDALTAMVEGRMARERGDTNAAVAAFRRAVVADPMASPAWAALADELFAAGDLDDAEDALWRAVDLRPSLLREMLSSLVRRESRVVVNEETFVDEIVARVLARVATQQPWRANLFVPSTEAYAKSSAEPFMEYSTCAAADFLHPDFDRIVRMIGRTTVLHRKLWEWVYIIHHLLRSGCVTPGKRGLVFGVGQEMLPALFASHGAQITATDAPVEIGEAWGPSNQFASGLSALPEGGLPREMFERLVHWEPCDMVAISEHLEGYDFCWSSCCFEHLGSLRAGMDFVINSVEHCLKPGGVAVHTTELNLSSNEVTLANGPTVIYRRRDIEQLIDELRDRGHSVDPFRIAPDTLSVDGYVDTPPYAGPHLKLLLEGYVSTSVGLVIKKRGHA